MKSLIFLISISYFMTSCVSPVSQSLSFISQTAIDNSVKELLADKAITDTSLLRRGVQQVASFWKTEDGNEQQFKEFCQQYFAKNEEEKAKLFSTLQQHWETFFGYYNKIAVELKKPLHLSGEPITPIDELFGAFEPFSHFTDDMFSNKIAFITMLNFPYYDLEEKIKSGLHWNSQAWAYARMGDLFTSRVPANFTQAVADALTQADTYISEYNIVMNNLRTKENIQLFDKELKLISHWGLRDELKSHYAQKGSENSLGLQKQRLIYNIMKHIVNQTIPKEVINNSDVFWSPEENKVTTKEGQSITATPENGNRYEQLFKIYQAEKTTDLFNPVYSTYIQRAFNGRMEVSFEDIEKLFTEFIASPQVKQVAEIISKRLGRNLEPFDIWYDGFKLRSTLSETTLTQQTVKKYPTVSAYQADLPNMLIKLGFDKSNAERICNQITVDASRGAGHAWGALMRGDKARLRTRIPNSGMDYKGYNIATHEFGHNVEQTISLNDVENYMLNGIPNTAFTEALAFIFQKRDLSLLGIKQENPHADLQLTLDVFWGCYEIMGVSLVDMKTWKWLYQNPQVTAQDLQQIIIQNAKEIWNQYYAPILGEKDSPILGIYSHMIDNPLYLPNYPYGHLIEFQLEQYLSNKNLGKEIQRIYAIGRLTPDQWMQQAVGNKVSAQPLLDATTTAIEKIRDID